MNESDFLQIVDTVCEHPNLYTPSGSFFQVVSFLDGYGIAAKVFPANEKPHSTFTPFCRWLASKFDPSTKIMDWTMFSTQFGPDMEAIKEFRILYGEYISRNGSFTERT